MLWVYRVYGYYFFLFFPSSEIDFRLQFVSRFQSVLLKSHLLGAKYVLNDQDLQMFVYKLIKCEYFSSTWSCSSNTQIQARENLT